MKKRKKGHKCSENLIRKNGHSTEKLIEGKKNKHDD
jgi:hypothetical protein